jgi:hypothetical protein
MSWDDHNRRRAAIKSVLVYAEKNPSAGLPFEQLPEVCEQFADRQELLLALQYDWSQALWARIELLSLDGGKRSPKLADAGELARTAWNDCAAKHPTLRRLLDVYRDELGPSTLREQHIMTIAGIGHTASGKKYVSPYVA